MTIVLFFVFTGLSSAALGNCELETYFDQPTPSKRIGILAKGHLCIPDLIQFFKDSEDPQTKVECLNLLITPLGPSSERETFLQSITSNESSSQEELMRVSFYDLLQAPHDPQLQTEVKNHLAENDWNLDFSLFGYSGLIALESLFLDSADENVHYFSSKQLIEKFPLAVQPIIIQKVDSMVNESAGLPFEEAQNIMFEAGVLLATLGQDSDTYIMEVLDKAAMSGHELGEENSLRNTLISDSLNRLTVLNEELSDKLIAFFLNPHTLTEQGEESNEIFSLRRNRLLNFLLFVNAMDKNSSSGLAQMLEENAVTIFSSDLPELLAGMVFHVSDSESSISIATALLKSGKPKLVQQGLRIIHEMPRGLWVDRSDETAVENLIKLIKFYAQYGHSSSGTTPIPENLRLAAAAALVRVGSSANQNIGSILSSLSSQDPQIRIQTIELAGATTDNFADLMDAIIKVIRYDDEPDVRIVALQLVLSEMTQAKAAMVGHPIFDSKSLGLAILYTWNTNNEELATIATEALDLYSERSIHAQSTLLAGLASNNSDMSAAASSAMTHMIVEKMNETNELLYKYSQNASSITSSYHLFSALQVHIDQLSYLISRVFESEETPENEDLRLQRIGIITESAVKLASILEDLSINGSSEEFRAKAASQLAQFKQALAAIGQSNDT
jgi:hypothetical protein